MGMVSANQNSEVSTKQLSALILCSKILLKQILVGKQ